MCTVISVQCKVSFRKTVLNDLFDLFALRKEAAPNARNLAPMTFEQLLEGAFVARSGSGDQHIICRFGE